MRVLSSINAVTHIALFEESVKSESSPWIRVPSNQIHWSFAIATKHNLEEDGKIEIEVSNDETEPAPDLPGSVVALLQHNQEAAYITASYRFMRAVRVVGAKPLPVTVYAFLNCPA